ncbi:MAG: chromosome segregation protein SMC [Ruminococcus sp.]|jgi:chromosome segregation protein
MYLKSIEVQGFKSFANKISFEFHNGITGIVGPNGSGKSNVADAVRWVLGEQSAKQLRGGNMQDVIFAGTENRKPLGFASVAITLDNSDHKLDIEFEEVTVTRRLYRSGESEYLLNGCSCRLKDINELFYDTGIGKEGYSIIGQGQIDRILSGKPEERRELFDEAAGIVKFKRRKNTALKKLAEEQQNLVRVSDILSELKRQIGPLERQSETARIYLRKREELKRLEASLFLSEMEQSSRQLGKLEEDCRNVKRELEENSREFDRTREEYEKLEQNIAALEQEIEERREKASGQAVLRQQIEGQINVLREQINTDRQNEEHYKERILALEEEIEKRQESERVYGQEKENLSGKRQEAESQRKEKEQKLQEVQEKLAQCISSIEEGKASLLEILNQRASTKGKMQRYDAMLEQIQIRRSGLNQRILRMKTDGVHLKESCERYQREYERVTASIDEMGREQKKMNEEVAALQESITEQSRQMDVGQAAYHREASRLESLKNLAERYDGFGNSIRKVMEQRDKNPGIKGVVADLIQTDKKYETAVETALGGSIQNIVTDNENTAKAMIDFLKKNRYGRATFLPLTTVKGSASFSKPEVLKEKGVIGVASQLVTSQKAYASLLAQLLGKTVVVDHIDHAIAIGRKYRQSVRMVTLEGELFNPGGSMTGGAFKNSSNLLGRRREIEELEANVKMLKKDMEDMQRSIDGNRSRRNVLRDTIAEISDRIREQYVVQNTARMNLEQTKEKIAQGDQDTAQVQGELKEIEQQVREIRDNSSRITDSLEEYKKKKEELESKVDMLQKQQEKLAEEEEEQLHWLEEAHLQEVSLKQKEEFAGENITRIQNEIKERRGEIRKLSSQREQGGERTARKEEQIQKLEASMKEEEASCVRLEKEIQEHTARKEEMNGKYRSFFVKRDELSQKMNLLDKESFRLNHQKEKLEENREQKIQYMWEEYEITPGSAGEFRLPDEKDDGTLKRGVSACKEEIRKLGPVNVNAIEEYKELKERHDFLETQHRDLVESEKTLLGIIDELDIGMRRQFTEKFAEIQREFDRAFKELFGGGKGTLELMEEEDVLEAGIRIVSQPPGKKLQNMMQLSGGEKALTAIALLFAIQNLKPSPFCLLDEIEAALDDSNVTRFAQYLHKLTKNTQFIIITHRRGTMTAADRLYGITMQEKGVSTLVSVNLIEHDLDK